jgi:hypothetical protein
MGSATTMASDTRKQVQHVSYLSKPNQGPSHLMERLDATNHTMGPERKSVGRFGGGIPDGIVHHDTSGCPTAFCAHRRHHACRLASAAIPREACGNSGPLYCLPICGSLPRRAFDVTPTRAVAILLGHPDCRLWAVKPAFSGYQHACGLVSMRPRS